MGLEKKKLEIALGVKYLPIGRSPYDDEYKTSVSGVFLNNFND